MENGSESAVSSRPATFWHSPRRVLGLIIVLSLFLAILGGAYAFLHRHDTICRDGRAPKAQRDYGLGQVQYLCHDGQIVTKP